MRNEIINLKKAKENDNSNKTHNNFHIKNLQIKKQIQLVYSGGKVNSSSLSYNELGINQTRMLKKISDEQKRKVIRLKKIKSNKE